ncbi:MAG: hypothetical protein AAB516_01915 [Patescibacteria group bacterium]
MDEEKKISLPEIILMVLIVGVADIFGIIAGLVVGIPAIGQILIIVSLFISIIVWLIVQFWLIMKGVNGWWYGGGSLVDIISGGSLPLQTPTLIVTIFIANNPKLSKVAGIVKGKPPTILAKGNIAK